MSNFLSIFTRSLVFILPPSDWLFVSLEIDFSGCHLPVPPKKAEKETKYKHNAKTTDRAETITMQ